MSDSPEQTAPLWRHAGFRRLYFSTASFSLGTQIYQLAMPLLLYELTRSPHAMSSMRAVELLPNLLLAMFIGVWVDRIDRGRWARLAMAGMVALMGLQLLLLHHQGAQAVPSFLLTGFALMTLNYLYGICRMGMIKEMLPTALLLPATGQLTVLGQVSAVLGPALAGGLLAWQLSLGLWAPMLALLLAAWLLRDLVLPVRRPEAQGFWVEWFEGWRVLRANRPLWQLSWLVVLINGSAGVADLLFLFRARESLQLGPAQIGLLYGLAGFGGIFAGLYTSPLRQGLGLGRLLTLSLGLEAACIALLGWCESMPALALALLGNCAAQVLGNVCVWGYRQESTDSRYIGRISGLTGSIFKLLMPLTLVLSGSLAGQLHLGWMLSACAGAHLLALLGARLSAIYRVA